MEYTKRKKTKKQFIKDVPAVIVKAVEIAVRVTERAFGGCKNCYGKGYHTTIEYAHAGVDFQDHAPGAKGKMWKLPEVRFCKCERGQELEKRFSEARKSAIESFRESLINEVERIEIPELKHQVWCDIETKMGTICKCDQSEAWWLSKDINEKILYGNKELFDQWLRRHFKKITEV